MRPLLALLLAAAQPQATTVDLPRVAAAAVQHAPAAGAARARASAAQLRAELEQPSPLPELLLGGRLWAMASGGPGDPELTTRYRVYAMLRLPLLRAAAAAQSREVVQAASAEAEIGQQVQRAQLLREVGLAYAVLRAAQEAAPAYQGLCDARQRQLQVARARLSGGMGTAAEVARAEQQLRAAQLLRDEARRGAETARARLEALSGLSLSGTTLTPVAGMACTAEEAARLAGAQRPEVRLRQAESGRHRAQAQLAWRDAIDLTVGVGASHGTTGTLDDVNGLSALLELRGPLDAPLRARKQQERDLSAARGAALEAAAIAQQVGFEARAACDAEQQARAQVAVLEAELRYARAEHERLRGRRALVPEGGAHASVVEMPQLLDAEAAEREVEARLAEARGRAELARVERLLAQGDDISAGRGFVDSAALLGEPGSPSPGVTAAAGVADSKPSRPLYAAAAIGLPGASSAPAADGAQPAAPAAQRDAASVRGLWVWHTRHLLREEAGAERLLSFVRARGVNEVYLSFPRGIGGDQALAALVAALRRAGLRVEALLGEAVWYERGRRAEMLGRLGEVARWNRTHPQARFDGVHLDIEPQQLTAFKGARNLRFLPELTATLDAAREAAAQLGLSVAADLPRKVLRASAAERAALRAACPRLFFMLYDLTQTEDIARAARLALRDGAEVVVGLRPQDHEGRLDAVLESLAASLRGEAGLRGFAIHDYDSYRRR